MNVFDGVAQDLDAAPRAPEWLASANAVASCAEACLGSALVGVYVHGSAALGGWLAHVSDLDVFVVADARQLAAGWCLSGRRSVDSPVLALLPASSFR